MTNVIILLVILGCIIYFFNRTKFGKRLKIRASGTADEVMNEDATTLEGAKAYYNAAIDKKKKDCANSNSIYAQTIGQISEFEKQLRVLQKDDMRLGIEINSCIDSGNDEGAKVKLKAQQDTKEKIEVLKTNLNELYENEKIHKETLDRLQEELDNLISEKDKQIFILETMESTESLKVNSSISDSEEDQMLEKVRDGIKKKKQIADGNRIAYENSTEVQQKRLDKQLKDAEIEKILQELKGQRGK